MAKHKDSKELNSCKSCGCKLPSRPQEYRKGNCGKCFQAKKKQAAIDLLLRPCKTCGKPIDSKDKRQVVCSKRCGHDGRSQGKVLIECAVCGKQVERYTRHASKFKVACCSLGCQRQHALNENRGGKKRDWDKSSAKARKEWYRLSQKQRRDRRYGDYTKAIFRKIEKAKPQPLRCPWVVSIGVRLATGANRDCTRRQVGKVSGSIERAIQNLYYRRKYHEIPDWKKKVSNKLSSMSGRRRRKANAKNKKNESRSDTREDSAVWAQMCFDWMVNIATVL